MASGTFINGMADKLAKFNFNDFGDAAQGTLSNRSLVSASCVRLCQKASFASSIGCTAPLAMVNRNGYLCRFQRPRFSGSVPQKGVIFRAKTAKRLRRYIKE